MKAISTFEIDDIKVVQWEDGDIGFYKSSEFIKDNVHVENFTDKPLIVVGDQNILKLINELIKAYAFAKLQWEEEDV